MRNVFAALCGAFALGATLAAGAGASPAAAQTPAVIKPTTAPPLIPYESVQNYFKYPFEMNLGDMAGVAVNSKGHVYMLSRSNISGPAYSQMGAQVLEFDEHGNFMREVGKGLYAWSFVHAIRVDKQDFIWVVDKGSDMAVKIDPNTGHVAMVFGRRAEASDEAGQAPRFYPSDRGTPKVGPPTYNAFRSPTDVAWDSQGNAYFSDGYVNSRVAVFDPQGMQIATFGEYGKAPGQFDNPHGIAVDNAGNIYVADRSNGRTQVFDKNYKLVRIIDLQKVPYAPDTRPWIGAAPKYGEVVPGINNPGAPWTLCITPGPTQYLYIGDGFPGRVYKMTLDGKLLGMFGKTGKGPGEFGWVHELACPSENELYVADENNWRVQKILLHPEKTAPAKR